ncbi:MAG: radical SAM protein [Elusimicrobia bacterium]|nr:radical SAM protein [Elusimicrobiota bacterium]
MRLALVQMPPCPRDTPPSEMALTAAVLRREGHEVRVFDISNELFHGTFKSRPYWKFALTAHSKDPHSAIAEEESAKLSCYAQEILAAQPQAVVFKAEHSCRGAEDMARELRALAPDLTLIGSGLVSTDPVSLKRWKEQQDLRDERGRAIVPFDRLIIGEDDLALPAVLAGKGLERFAAQGKVVDTSRGPWLEDLDSLPHYDFTDYDFKRYSDPKTIRFSVSRGCPFRCAYCRDWVWTGKFRSMSVDRWFEEYKVQHERNAGVRHLRYCDRLINGDMKALDRFCGRVIEAWKEAPIYWGADFVLRPELDEEFVGKLARAGCNNMGVGLESGSEKVRAFIHKGFFSNDLAERVFASCRKNRIHASVNVMIGLPGETKEDLRETVDFIERNASNIWEVRLTSPTTQLLPGTPLAEQPARFGIKGSDAEKWESEDGSNSHEERVRRFEEFCLRMLDVPGLFLAVNRRVIKTRTAVEKLAAECRQEAARR